MTTEAVGGTSYGKRLTEIACERADEVDLIMVARDGAERGVSWRELEERANQIARELEVRGVVQGGIVALAMPSCVDHILTLWPSGSWEPRCYPCDTTSRHGSSSG